tara:strand:+ start:505 stop:630 length:126 start_codon:yes stop_codon:yes gene_type:complete
MNEADLPYAIRAEFLITASHPVQKHLLTSTPTARHQPAWLL